MLLVGLERQRPPGRGRPAAAPPARRSRPGGRRTPGRPRTRTSCSPPTVTRHPPHMPGAVDHDRVEADDGLQAERPRRSRTTARIIGSGPTATTSSKRVTSGQQLLQRVGHEARACRSDPSSVVTMHSSATARMSSSRIMRSFVRAPMIATTRPPCALTPRGNRIDDRGADAAADAADRRVRLDVRRQAERDRRRRECSRPGSSR